MMRVFVPELYLFRFRCVEWGGGRAEHRLVSQRKPAWSRHIHPSFRTQAAGTAPLFSLAGASRAAVAIPPPTEWLSFTSDGAVHANKAQRHPSRTGASCIASSLFEADRGA